MDSNPEIGHNLAQALAGLNEGEAQAAKMEQMLDRLEQHLQELEAMQQPDTAPAADTATEPATKPAP